MAKEKPKTDTDQKKKTPLQEQKEKEKIALTEAGAEGKPKRKRAKRKTKPEPVKFDVLAAQKEAEFFLEMIGLARNGLGVKKPLGRLPSESFVSSYAKIAEKYGDVASKWMPEIMFVGSCSLIAFDTFSELKSQEVVVVVDEEPVKLAEGL